MKKLSIALVAAFVGLLGVGITNAGVENPPAIHLSLANQTTPYYFEAATNYTDTYQFTNILTYPWRLGNIAVKYGAATTNTLTVSIVKRKAHYHYAPDSIYTNGFGTVLTNNNSIQLTNTTYSTIGTWPILTHSSTNVTYLSFDAENNLIKRFYVLRPDIFKIENTDTNVSAELIFNGLR